MDIQILQVLQDIRQEIRDLRATLVQMQDQAPVTVAPVVEATKPVSYLRVYVKESPSYPGAMSVHFSCRDGKTNWAYVQKLYVDPQAEERQQTEEIARFEVLHRKSFACHCILLDPLV